MLKFERKDGVSTLETMITRLLGRHRINRFRDKIITSACRTFGPKHNSSLAIHTATQAQDKVQHSTDRGVSSQLGPLHHCCELTKATHNQVYRFPERTSRDNSLTSSSGLSQFLRLRSSWCSRPQRRHWRRRRSWGPCQSPNAAAWPPSSHTMIGSLGSAPGCITELL